MIEIKSPLTGIFRAEPPDLFWLFAKLGLRAGPETVVGVVEVWNDGGDRLVEEADVKVEIAGRVVEVLVNDGDLVDRGEVLFKVEPD